MREENPGRNFFWFFSGWRAAGVLLIGILLVEVGLSKMGGDSAAFLYVTFHFIVVPLWSVCVLIATVLNAFRIKIVSARVLTLSSIIIPIFLLYITCSGNTWLPELLGVNFNK